MKRYLLFAGVNSNPKGGYLDIILQTNDLEEATNFIEIQKDKWDWYHLIDALTDRLMQAKNWDAKSKKN